MIDLELRIEEKRYPGAEAPVLHDLALMAHAGQFLAIVGPSGAGKSTMLNIVSGLDPEFSGEVRIAGQSLHETPAPEVRSGFVFQEPRLMPWMTVRDNLKLVLPREHDADERSAAMLAEVGLAEALEHYPGQLSGGMQRRAALARAFVVRPTLLLLDEPFVSLDAPTATRLRELLLSLCSTYRPTVLMVTHDLREALALADRVVFLSGRPARVVLDLPVPLALRGDAESEEVGRLHHQLLERHPRLLSGLAAEAASPEQASPEQASPEQASPEQDSPEQDSPEQDSPEQDSPEQDSEAAEWRSARYP